MIGKLIRWAIKKIKKLFNPPPLNPIKEENGEKDIKNNVSNL